MLLRISRLWALLCLALALHLAAAHHIRLTARQEDDKPAVTATDSEPPPKTESTATATEGSHAEKSSRVKTDAPKPTSSDNKKDATTTFESKASEPTSVIITTDGALDNSTFYDGMQPYPSG